MKELNSESNKLQTITAEDTLVHRDKDMTRFMAELEAEGEDEIIYVDDDDIEYVETWKTSTTLNTKRRQTMSNSALRLTYYNIADGVCAFSTTRHGGTSEGNHASLNINPYCGDKPSTWLRTARCWQPNSASAPTASYCPTRRTAPRHA